MASHAVLSPSAAHRWLTCPASVRAIQRVYPDGTPGSVYALEGTHAHAVAENEAANGFGLISDREHRTNRARLVPKVGGQEIYAEMETHAHAYVGVLTEIRDRLEGASSVHLERRYQTGIPGCWGTADATISTPYHIAIVDYKYGQGVPVKAEGNEQLKLYALGALRTLDLLGDVKTVSWTVHQPRLSSVSSETQTVAELEEWAEDWVRPQAALALAEEGAYFMPSVDACRFCPLAGQCAVQTKAATSGDFGDPDLMDTQSMDDALKRLPLIQQWVTQVKDAALRIAWEEGIPGWKVVRSTGRRSIKNAEAAAEVLELHGFDRSDTTRPSMKTLTDLQRLVGGKSQLDELLGSLIEVSEGSLLLVPEDDKREAADRNHAAAQTFGPHGAAEID